MTTITIETADLTPAIAQKMAELLGLFADNNVFKQLAPLSLAPQTPPAPKPPGFDAKAEWEKKVAENEKEKANG